MSDAPGGWKPAEPRPPQREDDEQDPKRGGHTDERQKDAGHNRPGGEKGAASKPIREISQRRLWQRRRERKDRDQDGRRRDGKTELVHDSR